MSFQRRLQLAEEHERYVAQELEQRGWLVQRFGQGLLDERIQSALKDRETPMRWLPDLLACRGQKVVLIDAKAEQRKDTANFSLELTALTSMVLHKYLYGLPVVIVWDDLRVNTPDQLEPVRWVLDTDGWVHGSRTPFVLVRKTHSYYMDDWFGAPQAHEVTA